MSTTTQQETEFSNNNIKVKVKQQPGCQIHLDISISPAASKVAYAKAIKEVSKEISIPGFRRGKAPVSTVLQKFSPQVKKEWENILFNTAITEAMGLANLYPATDSNQRHLDFKIHSTFASKDEESTMKIEYETYPSVPEIDFSKLTLPETEDIAVDKEKSHERFQDLLISKAEWEVLENKKIEDGDFVDVTFSNPDEESAESSEDDSKKTRYWVRKDKLPTGYYNELIGRSVNDSFTFQDDEKEPVSSTIKAILKANLPEENDEFAQNFGAPDLATLKSRITQALEMEAKGAQLEIVNNDLIKQLIEKFPMDLPVSMISKHRKTIAKRILSNLVKMMPDSSNEERQTAVSQLNNVIDERALHVTQLRYVIHHLARENDITVTDKEFEDEMTQVYYRSQSGAGPYIDFNDNISEIQSEVFNQLMTQKVLSLIIDRIGKKS
ncbi:MAG: trigger factor [Parachlamydiaceae bacterium]|nr:trigger factor [Parachlamydiaceae bacterium]